MSESLNDIVSRIVLEHQLADEKKIEEALELQREILSTDGRKESLERVLVDMGVLKGKQLKGLRYAILYYLVRKVDRFYGKIAVQSKIVSSSDVDKALKEQKRVHNKERRLVRINKLLMEAGVLKKAEDKAITKAIEELRGNRKKRKKGETARSTAKTTIIKRTERFDDDDDAIEMLKSNLDDDELELDGISEDELESLDEVSDIDEVPTLDDDEFDELELDDDLDDDLELADDDAPKAKASQGSEGELDEADDLDDVELDSADLDLDDSDDAVDELESFEDELDEEEASNAVTKEDELESFEDDLDDDPDEDEAPAEEASETKEARRVSNKLAKASGSKRQKAESAADEGSGDELGDLDEVDDLELDEDSGDDAKADDDSGSEDGADDDSGDDADEDSGDDEDGDADDAKGKKSASGKLSLKERLAARKKAGGKDKDKKKKGTGKFEALRKKAPKPRKKKW